MVWFRGGSGGNYTHVESVIDYCCKAWLWRVGRIRPRETPPNPFDFSFRRGWAMEAMRQHLLAVAVSFWVEVIYICWHLPRRIDFTWQFLLVISSSFLMSVIIFSHSIMKPLGKQLECSEILESSRNKLYWTPVRVSSLGITGITGTLARKWPACSDCQWPLTRGIVTSTRID